MSIRLIRANEVKSLCGRSNSGLYADISAGVMVPPVKIGPRASAWPEHEVDAILRARIAGRSDAYIRELVARLVAVRTNAEPTE